MFGARYAGQSDMHGPAALDTDEPRLLQSITSIAGSARFHGFKPNTELIVRQCHRYFLVTEKLRVSESGV